MLKIACVNHFHERFTIMTTILAFDQGKFKSVCCFFHLDDGELRYVSVESTAATIGLFIDTAKELGYESKKLEPAENRRCRVTHVIARNHGRPRGTYRRKKKCQSTPPGTRCAHRPGCWDTR